MPDGSNIVSAPELAALQGDIKAYQDEVRTFATDILAKVNAGQDVSKDLTDKADKALTELNGLRARQDEIEQKLARRGSDDERSQASQTPGEVFLAAENVKAAMATRGWRGRARVDMAAITTAGVGARNILVPEDRQGGLIASPERRMTVRDLLTPGRTNSNAIQYVREFGFSNAAATVSEGELKPESDIDFELKTANVATIAHWIRASKQIMEDAPMLQSHIDGRLRYGLAFVEENKLLNAAGGSDIDGIIPNATAFSRTFTPENPNRMDDIRLAILQVELAYYPASGVVLHPTDWARIELSKDLEARYLIGMPQGNIGPRLWGLPVVATQAMTSTKFLVGAFRLGAQLFDREDASVEISSEDNDNFVRNLVTIRAEERLVLAIYRPEAFVYGTFMTGT